MAQKLYPNLVHAVAYALAETIEQPYPADKVLARMFKSTPQWGARDRSFIAETTYDILRYLRRYTEPDIRPIPWNWVIGWHLQTSGHLLPDWKEWSDLPASPHGQEEEPLPLAIRESITDWMDKKGKAFYGDRWEKLVIALNQPATVVLRINPIKATLDQVRDVLDKEGWGTIPLGPLSLELEERANVFRTEAFKAGWFEVQDYASQQVALALDITPGQRVVDGCAGAGGKTLQIAALLENRGQVIALDPDEWKLNELKRRARRGGVDNVQARLATDTKAVKRLHQSADRVLLDVPCTGSGVLRRNPDAKWRIDQTLLDRCLGLQEEILEHYAPVCKKGGRLVYATCSIFPEENQHQIARFLNAHKDYTLISEKQLLPDDFGYDGFYIAVLEKGK